VYLKLALKMLLDEIYQVLYYSFTPKKQVFIFGKSQGIIEKVRSNYELKNNN
jgi:hypothetical protein